MPAAAASGQREPMPILDEVLAVATIRGNFLEIIDSRVITLQIDPREQIWPSVCIANRSQGQVRPASALSVRGGWPDSLSNPPAYRLRSMGRRSYRSLGF